MKVEKYYDVGCDFCGRHLSTDFYAGFFTKREWALREAKRIGFRTRQGQNICPDCLEERRKNNE